LESWRAIERIFQEGRARAIGVSNFLVPHLEELFDQAQIKPSINQIELHPFLQQKSTVDWCEKNGVVVEAYCPVTRGQKLDHATVVAIAQAVGKTPAQVLIRWSLQRGFVVIPKSSNKERIHENAAVFDFSLSDDQMKKLDGLEEGFRLAWDPNRVG
jgi:diketogulonate reductase-like aldo/keto reductase